ncbi:hypothetical protein EJB05_13803, partial [Eragrostis curvula]
MEIIVSAVLGELTTRSINFFINKSSKPTLLDAEGCLRRVVLRAIVIIDEAMGRQITNEALLLQLDMLRDAMHRGCYMLDIFRYQSHDKDDAEDQSMSHSSLFKLNYIKGFCSSSRNAQISKQLQKAHDDLISMILNVEELVTFLPRYPRLYRQPYSMHLLLDNCMFGRQMEAELTIKFLLHTQPLGSEELEVLPIVGPGRVGKSTLVAHICKDERVSNHFSEILFLRYNDVKDDELAAGLREGCAMKHQSHVSNSENVVRLLVIVELAGDLNEDAWNRMYSASKYFMPRDSKVIITSRSDKIVKFGTTRALTLKYLSHEAYWYFFKTLAFGSMDPEMHPKFTQLAMEVAGILNNSLLGANITAHLLRDNFDIHFWRKVLDFVKVLTHSLDLIIQGRPAQLERMDTSYKNLVVRHQYKCPSQEAAPKIGMVDVVYGRAKPRGKFEALVWRSRIPPFYNYIYSCEIREQNTKAAKRKRSLENRVTIC